MQRPSQTSFTVAAGQDEHDEADIARKKMRRPGSSSSFMSERPLTWIAVVMCVVLVVACVQFRSKMQSEMVNEQQRTILLQHQNSLLQKRLEESLSDVASRDRQLEAARKQQQKPLQVNSPAVDDKHVQLLEKKVTNYKTEMKEMSLRVLKEKFGKGPHRVEIMLEFPAGVAGTADRIVVELAPIEEMPHTVHLFLEQVDRKLYDGCSFHRNAGHVVQGGPARYFNTPATKRNLNQPFKESGYHHVSFQEYSPAWPHVKYTMGYAGRPGGPDFYVSTRDNTRNHGPGGQASYEDPTEADPCFAKVVSGFEAVDRICAMPVKPNNSYKALQQNVGIKSMKILKN